MIHLLRILWYLIIKFKMFKFKTCNYFKPKVLSIELVKKENEVVKKVIETLEEAPALEEPNGNVAEPVKVATLAAPEQQQTIMLKDKAYSMVYDSKLARWQALELYFDYESGTFGGLKVIESNPQKYIIVERVQTLIGRNLF